jgi:hypothetical protein
MAAVMLLNKCEKCQMSMKNSLSTVGGSETSTGTENV